MQAERRNRARVVRVTSHRADAIVRVGDLRRTDHVLDVGCADGQVVVDIAPFVAHVHGVDISADRVAEASGRAAERAVRNATFETVPIQDHPLEPMSWDVSLFMRTWGKGAGARRIGGADLNRVLRATRRQAFVLAGVKRDPERLPEILRICEANGFDALCFIKPHLIVANRRDSDARIRVLPKYALVQDGDGLARTPTASLDDHPIVRSLLQRAA